MRTFSALILLLTLWPASSLAQDQLAGKEIQAIVAEQAAAWNAGDASGYARHVGPVFVPDDAVPTYGTVEYSRYESAPDGTLIPIPSEAPAGNSPDHPGPTMAKSPASPPVVRLPGLVKTSPHMSYMGSR